MGAGVPIFNSVFFMKLFVWDFHGTLEKGNEHAVVEITNHVLQMNGYVPSLNEALAREWYGKKWYEFFEYMLPDKPHATHIQLQEDCITYQRENPDVVACHIQPNNHAKDVLRAISHAHDQILISNTRLFDLEMFLRATGLDEFFPHGKFFGIDAHQINPKSNKKDVLKKYLIEKSFEKIIIVGDSPHDMIPIESAITYLYAHKDRPFRECEATHKIKDLRSVLKEL